MWRRALWGLGSWWSDHRLATMALKMSGLIRVTTSQSRRMEIRWGLEDSGGGVVLLVVRRGLGVVARTRPDGDYQYTIRKRKWERQVLTLDRTGRFGGAIITVVERGTGSMWGRGRGRGGFASKLLFPEDLVEVYIASSYKTYVG